MTDYKDRVSGWATDIDWSKAPEGATHYQHDDGEKWLASWIKKGESDVLMSMLDDGKDTMWGPGGLFSKKKGFLIARPAPQWNGEGLPPVGTLCEHDGSLSMRIPWSEVRILAHAQIRNIDVAVFQCGDTISHSSAGHFRLIKTPAQIAADEREATIEAMIGKIKDHPLKYQSVSHFAQLRIQEDACADLYDAGLRFPKGDDK